GVYERLDRHLEADLELSGDAAQPRPDRRARPLLISAATPPPRSPCGQRSVLVVCAVDVREAEPAARADSATVSLRDRRTSFTPALVSLKAKVFEPAWAS